MKHSSAVAAVAAALLCAACGESVSLVDPSTVTPTAPPLAAEVAAVSSARAAFALPFRGSFEGTQTVTPLTPPFADVQVSAEGNATHLGRFTIELPHIVNFADRTALGTATLVAANGDVLVADFAGQAQVGAIVSIVEHATITGGTGRFAAASGSFTIERVFDPAAGTTIGSFRGTISTPGAGR